MIYYLKYSAQYPVFPATFHVISRRVDFLCIRQWCSKPKMLVLHMPHTQLAETCLTRFQIFLLDESTVSLHLITFSSLQSIHTMHRKQPFRNLELIGKFLQYQNKKVCGPRQITLLVYKRRTVAITFLVYTVYGCRLQSQNG